MPLISGGRPSGVPLMAGAGRILVVDDEPAVQRTLRANLVARGYDVVAVDTGEEALSRFDEWPSDLVVLDLMLPGLSGLEVCETLREHSSVPILVLSVEVRKKRRSGRLTWGPTTISPSPSESTRCWRVSALSFAGWAPPVGATRSSGLET